MGRTPACLRDKGPTDTRLVRSAVHPENKDPWAEDEDGGPYPDDIGPEDFPFPAGDAGPKGSDPSMTWPEYAGEPPDPPPPLAEDGGDPPVPPVVDAGGGPSSMRHPGPARIRSGLQRTHDPQDTVP